MRFVPVFIINHDISNKQTHLSTLNCKDQNAIKTTAHYKAHTKDSHGPMHALEQRTGWLQVTAMVPCTRWSSGLAGCKCKHRIAETFKGNERTLCSLGVHFSYSLKFVQCNIYCRLTCGIKV